VQTEKIGNFRIVETIGKGAMGVVYRAIDEQDGSQVALKVFYPDTQLSPDQQTDLLRRFEKEAEILKAIKHENVVGYREFGRIDGKEYLAMEFLEGQNLKELIEMGVTFTVEEVVDIAMQALSGLCACHEQGIIHRDIKPANIIKLPNGVVKLTDFGIARILTEATISRTGTVVGTPNYMSPEQIKGEELSPASDLFSLGVVLYELLTKRKPFDADTITSIMYNVVNLEPPPLSFYNPELPPALEIVLKKALAKNPSERYSTARSFQKDLMAVIDKLPLPKTEAEIEKTRIAAPKERIIYCVDCGTMNPYSRYTCIKCHQPLLKRDQPETLKMKPTRAMPSEIRFDRALLIFLNTLLAAIILFVIYLFFYG